MSRGLSVTGRSLFLVLAVVLTAAAPVLLSGCGGGAEDEEAAQPVPEAMVPGGGPDTTVVDTTGMTETESAYEAGTLPGAEGVTEDPAAEIKAVPAEKEAPPETTPARSQVAPSSGEGDYSLQLGSFTNLANARKQAERISTLGYAPVVEDSNLGGQTYHRVMLKGVGDMAEASRLGELIHSELGIAYLVRRTN